MTAPSTSRTSALVEGDRQSRVRRRLERATAAQRGPAPLLALVRSPALGVDVSVANPGTAFHAASVGKLVTGAVTMQLAEHGALDLDAPVVEVLGADAVHGLVVVDGRDRSAEITARQLLAHTSGVPDGFAGRLVRGHARGVHPLARQVIDDPDRRWAIEDVLEHTRRHQRASAGPGARFEYSDTGFALLSLVVSALERRPFPSVVESRVLKPLGLTRSWMPAVAPETSSIASPAERVPLAPILLGGTDLSGRAGLSIDSFGGGGIAFAPADLADFVEALHSGRIVSAASLAAMTDTTSRFRSGLRYGLAMMRVRFGEFSPFLRSLPDATGHLGVSAAHAWRIEPLDATIVLSLGSDRAMTRSFRLLIDIVRSLSRPIDRSPHGA